jgi:hypothetical protein
VRNPGSSAVEIEPSGMVFTLALFVSSSVPSPIRKSVEWPLLSFHFLQQEIRIRSPKWKFWQELDRRAPAAETNPDRKNI